MADNSEINKKGFSGLSDLASESQGLEPKKLEQPKLSEAKQQPQRQGQTVASEPERQTTNSPLSTVNPEKNGGMLQNWYNNNTPGQRMFLWILSALLILLFGIGLIPLALFIYLEMGRRANK